MPGNIRHTLSVHITMSGTDDPTPHGRSRPDADLEHAVEQLLVPILQTRTEERQQALERACVDHPALEALLRRRFALLSSLGLDEDGRAPIMGAVDPTRIGRYRVLRRLGRGAMGTVYLAEYDARQVAIKLMRHELWESETARRRFAREVDAASRLDHPSVCPVLEAGEFDGAPFLVMPYIAGTNLATRLRQERGNGREATATIPASLERVALVEALARAVHHVHEAGLVHRDVKPENVIVRPDGQPVLLDFGLAKPRNTSADGLTQSTDMIGTPAYMAPEQIRGDPVDPRTDVYALGVFLFELLTLQLPFHGTNRERIYAAILSGSSLPLRRLLPEASEELVAVVERAMARQPSRRYRTAANLANDLRRLMDGRRTQAQPPGPLQRLGHWTWRHRTATTMLALLVTGIAVSLTFLWRSVRAERDTLAIANVLSAARSSTPPNRAFEGLESAFAQSSAPQVLGALNAIFAELQEFATVRRIEGRFESVTRSPTGRWVVLGARNGVSTVHGPDGEPVHELIQPLTPQIEALAFAEGDRELFYSCRTSPSEGRPRSAVWRCELTSGRFTERELAIPASLGNVVSLACSPAGHLAVIRIANDRATMQQFDVGSGAALHPPVALATPGKGCAYLEDGRVATADGIHAPDGMLARRWDRAPTNERCVDVRRCGGTVCVASVFGARIYDLDGTQQGEHLRSPVDAGQHLRSVDAAADGALALTYLDGFTSIVHANGKSQWWHEGHSSFGMRFSPDGSRLVGGYWNGRITIRNRAGQVLHRWHGHEVGAHCAWLGDGERLLTGGWDGRSCIWTPGRIPGLPHSSGFPAAQVAAAGSSIAVASRGTLALLTPEGETNRHADLPEGGTHLLHHHAREGRLWVSSRTSGSVYEWNVTDGTFSAARDLRNPQGTRPRSVVGLGAESLWVAYGWDLRIRRFSTEDSVGGSSAGPRASLIAPVDFATAFVSVSREGALRQHRADGHVDRIFEHPRAGYGTIPGPTCIATDAEGGSVAVGREDGSVELWDAESGLCRWWPQHDVAVRAVAVAPSGSHVASVTSVGEIVVRSGSTGDLVLTWHLEGESLGSVAFVDSAVVTGAGRSGPGRIRWWWWDRRTLERRVEALRRRLGTRR